MAGVIRDDYGQWINGFQRHLGFAHSLLAGCWALRDGLQLAREIGIQSLLVELDGQGSMRSFLRFNQPKPSADSHHFGLQESQLRV